MFLSKQILTRGRYSDHCLLACWEMRVFCYPRSCSFRMSSFSMYSSSVATFRPRFVWRSHANGCAPFTNPQLMMLDAGTSRNSGHTRSIRKEDFWRNWPTVGSQENASESAGRALGSALTARLHDLIGKHDSKNSMLSAQRPRTLVATKRPCAGWGIWSSVHDDVILGLRWGILRIDPIRSWSTYKVGTKK